MPALVRPATREDVPAILAIYNEAVINTTASYDEEPHTLDQRLAWFDAHMRDDLAVLVAVNDQQGVVGWAALGKFRDKIGYRFSTEHSIYVAPGHRAQGVGSLLLPALIEAATRRGFHTMIAGMDAENEGSIRLHARFGFEKVAHFKQVGFKFGRWLDLVFMQLARVPPVPRVPPALLS
jgi:phosphinothricin acetyltransferase